MPSNRVLVQAVKRNIDRFPSDFVFQLTRAECENLKSQFVISSWGGARRSSPYAFTEQGVAMLSSVLRSPRAVHLNVTIMRAFVQLRQMLLSRTDLSQKLDQLEEKFEKHDKQIHAVFTAIKRLMDAPAPPRRRMGFVANDRRIS